MYTKGEEYNYFKNILNEIIKIIKLNHDIKGINDNNLDKLLQIIRHKVIDYYNKKYPKLRLGLEQKGDGTLVIFLSKYVTGRGSKKEYEYTIKVKSIIRQMKIDNIKSMK